MAFHCEKIWHYASKLLSFPAAVDLRPFVPEIDPTWTSATVPDRKGETQQCLYNRCSRFASALPSNIESKGEGGKHTQIIIVGHVAPLIALVRVLLGNMSQPMRLGCSSITNLRKAEDENWEAVRIGSGKHLEKGSLNDWGFEDMGLI